MIVRIVPTKAAERKESVMRYRSSALVGGLTLLAIGSPAGAASMTGKAVIRIDAKGAPSGGNPSGGSGSFALRSVGLVDKGADSYSFSGARGTVYLRGRKGDLVLQLKRRPSGLNVDSEGLDLWAGTWKVAAGSTGAYETL